MNIAKKECNACKGETTALAPEQQQELLSELNNWEIIDSHHLRKKYTFPDFAKALVFVNKISEISESQNHHPNISFTWGEVVVEIHTHKVDGLTENDFILAAKFDEKND